MIKYIKDYLKTDATILYETKLDLDISINRLKRDQFKLLGEIKEGKYRLREYLKSLDSNNETIDRIHVHGYTIQIVQSKSSLGVIQSLISRYTVLKSQVYTVEQRLGASGITRALMRATSKSFPTIESIVHEMQAIENFNVKNEMLDEVMDTNCNTEEMNMETERIEDQLIEEALLTLPNRAHHHKTRDGSPGLPEVPTKDPM